MPIQNAEKQARFRKNEALKKFAEQTFREWQAMAFAKRHNPAAVMDLLEKAATLPAGWTDEDFDRAQHRVGQLRWDLVASNNDLHNDIHAWIFSQEAFKQRPRAHGFVEKARQSEADAHALAAHLISAVKLPKLSDAEKAAAVLEAVRHVGREMSTSSEIQQSNATAVCLASMPSFYERPQWFLDALAGWLFYQLGDDQAKAFAEHLNNFDYEAWKWKDWE